MTEFIHRVRYNWGIAWSNKAFRLELYIGIVLNIIVLTALPFFFNFIEQRNGITLNDVVLKEIPSYDVSTPLVILFIGSMGLMVFRAIDSPKIFITFLFSYLFLTVFRMASIYFVPLNPPVHLVKLHDPIANLLYVGGFKTKDLFFSGHTSTIFLMALCLQKKYDRLLVLISTIIIASLLLVQHVHYTVDILTAPIFAYVCYYITKNSGLVKNIDKEQEPLF